MQFMSVHSTVPVSVRDFWSTSGSDDMTWVFFPKEMIQEYQKYNYFEFALPLLH